jgi:hypothetical protein
MPSENFIDHVATKAQGGACALRKKALSELFGGHDCEDGVEGRAESSMSPLGRKIKKKPFFKIKGAILRQDHNKKPFTVN